MVGPIAAIGDVDRDGCADLIQLVGGTIPLGGFWTYSGRDGSTLRIRPWPYGTDYGVQTLVSAGDIDGDGIGDYAVGVNGTQRVGHVNKVQIHSGRDERLLWEVRGWWPELFGWHIAGDLDVDGDDKPDLVVGAERAGATNWPWPGAISVYSNSGTLLYRITNLPGITYLGRSLAKVGDVDADGCDDFVSGAIETNGVVLLFSGKTGRLLHKVYGEADGVIGYSVTGCGDLDADGVPDFASGTAAGFGECGLVRVYSGSTGKALYSWRSPRYPCQTGFGSNVKGGQDVDLDGVPDVFVVNGDYDPSRTDGFVAIYSGRDGSRLMLHRIPELGGGRLIPMSAPPGERFPLYACIGRYIPPNSTTDVGRVMLYRAAPGGVESFGLACRGQLLSEPRLGIRANEPAGTRLHLSGGEAGGSGVLLLGTSRSAWGGWPLPFPLGAFGFPGCMLWVAPDLHWPVRLGSGGNAAGYQFVDLPLSLSASGLPLYGQWLALRGTTATPGGASEALQWRH